jgi:hypothetical protein
MEHGHALENEHALSTCASAAASFTEAPKDMLHLIIGYPELGHHLLLVGP